MSDGLLALKGIATLVYFIKEKTLPDFSKKGFSILL